MRLTFHSSLGNLEKRGTTMMAAATPRYTFVAEGSRLSQDSCVIEAG